MSERFYLEIVPAEDRADLLLMRIPVIGAITAGIDAVRLLVDDYASATAYLHTCRHDLSENQACVLQKWNGNSFEEVIP